MTHCDVNDPVESEDLDEVVRGVAFSPPRSPLKTGDAPSSRLGTTLLGKYRLDEVLGVGGMAVVYKATHRNGAERAIKMLLPEHSANEDIRRRFRREGRFANAVQHPGAVSVIDDDVSDDGAAFLVLELLRGVACDDLAAQWGRRLPVEAACAVALQVLDVLQAAHDRDIIHRDIKPANLFVLRDGTVKVLDFGIARVRQTMVNGGLTTKSGALLGTPAFMAPEQGLGAGTTIDERVDIWAVGATLFTFLSGLMVTRPALSLATVDASVPPVLADVVDRALQFDPAHRWESARAMRNALIEASKQCFAMPPGQTVLAALLASQGHRSAGKAAIEKAQVPRVGVTLPASPQADSPRLPSGPSRQPVPPLYWPVRGRHAWLASAALLLAAGWFAALPRAPGHDPPRVARSASLPVFDEQEPYVAPVPSVDKPIIAAASGGALPRSCAEARTAGMNTDGAVRIDPDGVGPIHAFEVFCTGMAPGSGPGAEREYLTLAHGEATGEPSANATSQVWRGGSCDCPDLTRRFTRVRLNPRTMAIDPSDGTFAAYDRPLLCEAEHRHHCGDTVRLAWGAPGSCRGPNDVSGRASIDLRGTPFAIAPQVRFVPAGFAAAGQVTIAKDRKTASLVGGGLCGSMVSAESTIGIVQDH